MQEQDSTLNISFHKKTLLLKALDKLKVTDKVADILRVKSEEVNEIIMAGCHDKTFNIHFHKVRYTLLALNEFQNTEIAAKELGICTRTLLRFMKDNHIKTNGKHRIGKKIYYIANNSEKKIA